MRYLILFFVILFIVGCSHKPSNEDLIIHCIQHKYPKLISKGPLVYPDSLKKQNVHGLVMVKALIDTLGNIKEKIIDQSSDARLNAAAFETVSTYKFTPAELGDKKVRVWLAIPIRF